MLNYYSVHLKLIQYSTQTILKQKVEKNTLTIESKQLSCVQQCKLFRCQLHFNLK